MNNIAKIFRIGVGMYGIFISWTKKKEEKNQAAVALGKLSAAKAGAVGMSKKGRKGGKARAVALSPERQSEIGRKAIPAYKELAAKVAELESAVGKHDAALGGIVKTLQQLIAPPDKEKRRIGF